MSDYASSLPVRTETNGDVVAKISDGTTNTKLWEVLTTKEGVVALRDPSSTNVLVVNSDGSINVKESIGVANAKHVFGTTVGGVPNTPSSVVNYTVTALKTFVIYKFGGSASGKAKVELKVGPAGSETDQVVGFVTTANGAYECQLPSPISVAAGQKILVVVTNTDKANSDLYAYINGTEA